MIVLHPDELESSLERVLARREAGVAIGSGAVSGPAAAALLHCDWAALSAEATIAVDCAEAWGAAVWRIGRSALRLLLDGGTLTAERGAACGLVDAIVPAGKDPLQWIGAWLGGRSELALDSAAALLRRRGGDPLERAEFARIFAVGEPQIGLAAFLGKRKAQWSVIEHEPQHH